MPCYHPLKAYRSATLNENGKRPMIFKSAGAVREEATSLPCGQCMGCRSDRSNEWAVRLLHERKMHGHGRAIFVTLTYSDEHVPRSYSLDKRALQLFHKRVYARKGKLRYFGCGEYGDQFARPHMHTLLFGPEWTDLVKHRQNERGDQLYTSKEMAELWPFGFHEIGDVTFQSAAYCARYCLKKVNGDKADEHYWQQSPIDGQMYRRAPEFPLMSLKPGIGAEFAKKFASDFFPSDFCIVDGRRFPVPEYYRKVLLGAETEGVLLRKPSCEPLSPALRLKRVRMAKANTRSQKWNRTPGRLVVREEVHRDRMSKSKISRPEF